MGTVKLADFGALGRAGGESDRQREAAAGVYTAPEVLRKVPAPLLYA